MTDMTPEAGEAVERFDFFDSQDYSAMVEADEGAWVMYADYKIAIARAEAAERERDEERKWADEHHRRFVTAVTERNDLAAELARLRKDK